MKKVAIGSRIVDMPDSGEKVRGYRPQIFSESGISISDIRGIKIKVSKHIDVRHDFKRWEFPYDKYIEYGPEDEWWARKWGFGKEVGRLEAKPVGYEVDGQIVCNQQFYDEMKNHIRKENE